MADTKKLERVYNVPLRKEYMKVPRWKRTEKAVIALRQFLQRHMKATTVLLSKDLNEKIWEHGIRNPPHHVKVTAVKDTEGIVTAQVFGKPVGEEKTEKTKKKTNANVVGKSKPEK